MVLVCYRPSNAQLFITVGTGKVTIHRTIRTQIFLKHAVTNFLNKN